MPRDIFISHSSQDEPLARKLVDILLEGGCGVSASRILCTSMEGLGITAGAPSFIDFLLKQIKKPKLVILLLTENYFASTFCVCELGATWGLKLPTFPLVVAPLSKSKLKGTLAVTQAGDIDNESYLDELRDVVITSLDLQPPTSRWSRKRLEFLKSARKIIKTLPKPPMVNRAELEEANLKLDDAVEEITTQTDEIERLSAMIEELKKIRPKEEVKKIEEKFSDSTDEERFEAARNEARKALGKLQRATVDALYHQVRDEYYRPSGTDEWDDVRTAQKIEEVFIHDDHFVRPGSRKSVTVAEEALEKLGNLIRDLEFEESDFFASFEEENDCPLSLKNLQFWNEFLS